MQRGLVAFAVSLTACGGSSECITTECPTGTAPYQSCGDTKKLRYQLGDASCTCEPDVSTSACYACQTQIAAYCAGGASTASCRITLGGAVTATLACVPAIDLVESTSYGGVTLLVPSPAPLSLMKVTMLRIGAPTSSTWRSSSPDATEQDVIAVASEPTNASPLWTAIRSSDETERSTGDFTLDLTAGSEIADAHGVTTYSGHGSLTAMLSPAPEVDTMGNVTLDATFSVP